MAPSLRPLAPVVLLFAILLSGPALLAQDSATRVTGSAIVEPLLQAMIAAAEIKGDLVSETTGSRTGLTMLCEGASALSTSTQAIDQDLLKVCNENDVSLVEFTLGHNILALIAHPAVADLAPCLDEGQLRDIFAPSASGAATTWSQLLDGAPEELALSVHVPSELTASHSLLDAIVSGDGLRSDALVTTDSVTEVSSTPGSIGVSLLERVGDATVLSLDTADSEGCRAPSAESVEDGLYLAASQLLLYANVARLADAGVSELLELVAGDESASIVRSAGFTPPTEAVVRDNRERLSAAQKGDAAPLVTGDFVMPDTIAGALRIGGSGTAYSFVNSTLEAFQAQNQGLSTTALHQGAAAGLRDLCAGALDLVFVDRLPLEEEMAACSESNIDTITLSLGSSALALLANANGATPACMRAAELGTVWRAESSGSILNWRDLDSEYADETLILFAPRPGSPAMDQLLALAEAGLVGRADIEFDDDPLYRAAATANVPGALTFMNWLEYERVLESGQERVRLLPLDVGEGCVAPSPESIRDGSWPLSRTTWLAANRSRLTLPQLQAFLWYLASDENLRNWQAAGYVDVRPATLNSLRATLTLAFDEATLAALERLNEGAAEDESAAQAGGDG
ncbi:MAG: substrate-binding domain-containing protein [Anaerolineaceae bacterium]|nr:substrate-binding domain-containing protein [Anaerolineaceae bacterium]MDE0329751.1 substrate-binding domain-containing protein [Anaerolineaceae bacterium]